MVVSIPLNHLPLRPSSLTTFQKRGFVTSGELEQSKNRGGITNLADELGVSLSEAASLFREVQGAIQITMAVESPQPQPLLPPPPPQQQQESSAEDGQQQQQQQQQSQQQQQQLHHRTIVTFCRSMDQLIGGGIALGEVTELVGLPGVGKTQLAMQLCIDARLPPQFGGVAGEAIYIDTEGSFSPERCWTMAEAFVNHVQMSAQRRRRNHHHHHHHPHHHSSSSSSFVPDWFIPSTILKGIHVYRIHDEAALTATIHSLPTFLKQKQQQQQQQQPIRLVIIDSIAFHYRCAPPGWDYMERTRSLTSLASSLADLANNFDVAVVTINQMTTKLCGRQVQLVPALGEAWAHSTTTRLLLSNHPSNPTIRTCTLIKSPHKPTGTAFYQVLECGIRDVVVNLPEEDSSSNTTTTTTTRNRSGTTTPATSSTKRIRTQY